MSSRNLHSALIVMSVVGSHPVGRGIDQSETARTRADLRRADPDAVPSLELTDRGGTL